MTSSEEASAAIPEHAQLALLCVVAAVLAHQVAAGPHLFDSGELAAASWMLGGSHPPGQTLHAVVARFFTLLPLGPLPARIALCSAACAVLIAALAMRATRALLSVLDLDRSAIASWAALAAGLGTVLATPVLRQALRVEVYTLALALTLASFVSLLAWARGDGTRAIWRAAFAGGLAASAHAPHGLVAALAGLALAHRATWWRSPRTLLWTLAFGVAGLGLVTYLPLRALAGAAMWGDPLSLAGLRDYVSAKAYWQNNLANPEASLTRELFEYGRHLILSTSVAPVLGAVALPWLCARQHERFAWCAVLATFLATVVPCLQPFEEKNPDNVAYLAPAVALLVIVGAAGLAAMASRNPGWPGWLGLAVLAAAPATQARLPALLSADLPPLETLAGVLVDTPPPRALVVATTDYAASSWMLARATDGARPDVALFCAGLAGSSWHWHTLVGHPAFDGRPIRGVGANTHERYLNGLLQHAAARVPIAAEREPPGRWPMRLMGPYLLLGASDATQGADGARDRAASIVEPAWATPRSGDAELGAAILRDHHTVRARRLLAAGRTQEAFASLSRGLDALHRGERESIAKLRDDVKRPAPPAVKDPDSFLLSREDAVRVAATYAWSIGRNDVVERLLSAQARRDDPRAFLQLAWIRAFEGNPTAAARGLDEFVKHAPERAGEALDLRRRLAR